tara:strand:+ start:13 stop:219 length:207 start_codon:yes stop_codon:yes gene_type:complete
MKKLKYKDIVRGIEMPVYWVMLDDDFEIDEINGKAHYDFEEMANELENRICEALNRNVVITISEMEDE